MTESDEDKAKRRAKERAEERERAKKQKKHEAAMRREKAAEAAEAERVRNTEVPPRPSMTSRDTHELIFHSSRGNKRDGKQYPATARLEVEYKQEQDGPFPLTRNDETSTSQVFVGQTTFTISRLDPETRYRFRACMGCWGAGHLEAYGVESVYTTAHETKKNVVNETTAHRTAHRTGEGRTGGLAGTCRSESR